MQLPTAWESPCYLLSNPPIDGCGRRETTYRHTIPSRRCTTRRGKHNGQNKDQLVENMVNSLLKQLLWSAANILLRIPRHLPPPPPASLEDALVCLVSTPWTPFCAQDFTQEIPLSKASLFSMLTYSWVSPLMVHSRILQTLLYIQLKWGNRPSVTKEPCKPRIYGN